jgi:hypothetical protein
MAQGERTALRSAGARAVGRGFPVELLRWLDGCTVLPWQRFQLPPPRTQRADVPPCALLHTAPHGLWGLAGWRRFPQWSRRNVVVLQEAQRVVEPSTPPPLPAEASTLTGPGQMAPSLLCHPAAGRDHQVMLSPCALADTILICHRFRSSSSPSSITCGALPREDV